MPKKTRIRLIRRENQGDAHGFRITSAYWITLPNGVIKFIEVSHCMHDPNGNGTGNCSNSLRARVLSSEDMEDETDQKVIDMIDELIAQNQSNGAMEVKVSLNAEDQVVKDRGTCVTKPAKSWREQGGVIYFSVTSDGTTGKEWILRFEALGYELDDRTKSVLRHPDFKPTKGVTTEVAVLKGELFNERNRFTSNIRIEAEGRKLEKPNAEIACLIRKKFTDKELEEMDLWWIIVMSDTINDSDGVPSLLGVSRRGVGRGLRAYCVRPGRGWVRGGGFAFAVSQVSAQTLAA